MKRQHYRFLTILAGMVALFDNYYFHTIPVMECTAAILFAIEGSNTPE